MAAPCQESAARFLAHTEQAKGWCLRLARVRLLQVQRSTSSQSWLEKATEGERGAAAEMFAR